MHSQPSGLAHMPRPHSLTPLLPVASQTIALAIREGGGEIAEDGDGDVSFRIDDFNRDPAGAFAVSAHPGGNLGDFF